MSDNNLIFTDYKQRCSSLGHILTCLPEPINPNELIELGGLLKEKETGLNLNGNKTKWSIIKDNRIGSLRKKEAGEDELPSGCVTHLNDVFRSVFWRRRRFLDNKFLEKGLLTEQDILDMASKADKSFYKKNEEHSTNEFIQGSWDNYLKKVRDTKSNYDLKSHDEAELTTLYKWQLNGYSWLIKESLGLDHYPEAELIYGLVNNPLQQLEAEKTRLFYRMGCPSDDNDNWIETKRQMERNMVFDIGLFKRDYPHYQFENETLDFEIPAQFRIRKFDVITTDDDIFHIKRRVMMSRIYLCEKELEIYKKIKNN